EPEDEGERDERDRDVDEEDHAPGRDVDEPAADGRADHERDAAPGRPLPDRRAARRARERRREHRERRGSEERARDSLQAAEDDERGRVRRRRAEDRDGAEARDADREHAELDEDLAERAADEDQGAEREEVRVDDPLLRREPAAEVVLDVRQRDVDHRTVDERHRRAQDARDERPAREVRHLHDPKVLPWRYPRRDCDHCAQVDELAPGSAGEPQAPRRIGRGVFLGTVAGGLSSLWWGKAAWSRVSGTISPVAGAIAPILPTQGWRIYTVAATMPVFDPATWRLRIGGLVEQPQELTYDQLRALPQASQVSVFHCVTGWTV